MQQQNWNNGFQNMYTRSAQRFRLVIPITTIWAGQSVIRGFHQKIAKKMNVIYFVERTVKN